MALMRAMGIMMRPSRAPPGTVLGMPLMQTPARLAGVTEPSARVGGCAKPPLPI
jgi:hypothetical protein